MKQKKVETKVEALLRSSQTYRDSDKELIIAYLQLLGANLSVEQERVLKQVSFESIRRVRQKFQERGQYLPSPAVAKQRRLKSYIVQQNAPTANPEHLGMLIEEQPKAISWLNDED